MRYSALLIGLWVFGVSSVARADRLGSARAQPLAEVSHSVTVSIDRGVARYRVRRTIVNRGTRTDEASVRIDLAHAAAVTGLRIRARSRWFDGELMEAQEARDKYRELTGIGAWQPKDPALLQWVWADEAHLQIFPVLAGQVSTVEYTLTAPLEYRDGAYVLSYPRGSGDQGNSLPLAEPVLTVEPGHGDALTRIVLDGTRIAPGEPVVLGAAVEPEWAGEGGPNASVGYAHSWITIERGELVAQAVVKLSIDHTFAGDLRVELVDPKGARHEVVRGAGDGNDLRGEYEIELDPPVTAVGDWALVVGDEAGLDVGTLDAWSLQLHPVDKKARKVRSVAKGLPIFIPDAPDGDGDGAHAVIEIEPGRIRRVAARLGRVVASAEHGFSRFEIDAAPRLSTLPTGASVVFVVDVSRSHSSADIDAQLRIASTYLQHVPDAAAQVVVFDRFAQLLFGEFVNASEFDAKVTEARAKGKLGRGNGSAFELGLAAAAKALRPRKGPTRIVALTDARLRTRFVQSMALRALAGGPRRAVSHIVLPASGYESSLARDDTHALSPIAAAHRGVLFHGAVRKDDKVDTRKAAMLGLVRPIAIDNFAVHGLDVGTARALPKSLREGTGYRAMIATDTPASRVVVTGKLWAKSVRRVVTHDRHFDVATAAFVFSEDEYHGLSKQEMRTVAFMGRAVSPVTSYLAVEPGVRPSVDGIDRGTIGLGGLGLIGKGAGGVVGSVLRPPPSLASVLAPAVKRCVASVTPGASWAVELKIETTGIEIVDVQTAHASNSALADCLVEGAWATLLPAGADWPQRRMHAVKLG